MMTLYDVTGALLCVRPRHFATTEHGKWEGSNRLSKTVTNSSAK